MEKGFLGVGLVSLTIILSSCVTTQTQVKQTKTPELQVEVKATPAAKPAQPAAPAPAAAVPAPVEVAQPAKAPAAEPVVPAEVAAILARWASIQNDYRKDGHFDAVSYVESGRVSEIAEFEVAAPSVEEAKPAEAETTASDKEWKDPITGMEFVWVPGGSFEMGDFFGDGEVNEKHIRTVRLDGFWMGKYEVTQGEWQKIMRSNPSYFKKGNNYPVELVSWNDAREFIKKLNSKHNGKFTFRLPSEAEWEYAARSGGKKEKWAGTSSESSLGLYAWYGDNSGGGTYPVGQKQPNGQGLYDMSGNVWEWCEDVYIEDYSKVGTDNPIYKGSGSNRVFRGGGWCYVSGDVRASGRYCDTPDGRFYNFGFRLARTP